MLVSRATNTLRQVLNMVMTTHSRLDKPPTATVKLVSTLALMLVIRHTTQLNMLVRPLTATDKLESMQDSMVLRTLPVVSLKA